MFKIKQIDHVVLRVQDINKMLAFYTNVLGCDLERSRPDIGLYHLRAGAALIDLVPVDGKLGTMGGAAPGEQGRNLDHFCLQIEPFDAQSLITYLLEHGIEAGEVRSRYGAQGDGLSLFIRDPEQNSIELKGSPTPP